MKRWCLHLPDGLLVSVETFGFYPCPPGPGCPAGSYHTLTSSVAFSSNGLHGTSGVTQSVGAYPESQGDVIAYDVGVNCDPIFGNPNAPECTTSSVSKVVCPVMGTIYDTIVPKFEIQLTITKSQYTGSSYLLPDSTRVCSLRDWCAPGGGPTGGWPTFPCEV
jgi:hypothetical protein